jgi:hypothetical protein
VRVACIDAQRFAPVAVPAAVAEKVLAVYGQPKTIHQGSRSMNKEMS